jgi:cobalt-zinc-cadmium efflux system outer membrane protein
MIMRFIKYITIAILCTFGVQRIYAQDSTTRKEDVKKEKTTLNLQEFLSKMSKNNLEYAAEKLNINISEAELKVAKLFPDPSLSVDYTDNKENGNYVGHALTYELSTTLELFGKRRARISIAKDQKALADAVLRDYYRNLKADASISFFESLKQGQLYLVATDSYKTMQKLSKADSIQHSLGNIAKIDALQSQLETGVLYNDLLQAQVDYENSNRQLSLLSGNSDLNISPLGKLEKTCKIFDIRELTKHALNNRADLEAARQSSSVSKNELKLARREQLFDVDVKVSLEDSYAKGISSPTAKALTAGVTIPLQFSNFNRGKIKLAKYKLEQAEYQYKQAELNIKIEVKKVFAQYNISCKKVGQYETGLLNNAKQVLDGKIYSYKRGETSLLEVLNAQRTYNDVRTSYFETLYNNAVAFIELERTVGM